MSDHEMNQTPFAEHYRYATDALLDGLVAEMATEWYGETFSYAYGQAWLARNAATTEIEEALAEYLALHIRQVARQFVGIQLLNSRHE